MARAHGTVLDEAARPVRGIRVQLEAESIRGERTTVANGETDAAGRYSLDYELKRSPFSIRVAVLRKGTSVVAERRISSPRDTVQVDFRLGAAPGAPAPGYAQLEDRLRGVLEPEMVELSDLDLASVARAALAAGVSPARAAGLQRAERSAKSTGLPPELFIALGAGGLSYGVAANLRQPSASRREAVERAIADGMLTENQAEAARSVLPALDARALDAALEVHPIFATPGLAFELAGIEQGRREILERWAAHEGPARELWDQLELEDGARARLRFALQLSALTRQHAPLVRKLFQSRSSLVELAALTREEWKALVDEVGLPPTVRSDADYGGALFEAMEAAAPTAMLAARSDWFSSSGALARFLDANPAYDLRGRAGRAYLRAHADALDTLDEVDREEVETELPVLERLYKVSPDGARFETMRRLRAAGFRSATQILHTGAARFVMIMDEGLGPDVARDVFDKARGVSSAALTLTMRHGADVPAPGLAVLPPRDTGEAFEASEWASMFGGRTYCACEECQSAHGPGAYLADLLFWLRGRGEHLSRLRARRPDIEQLRLSCKNARTALPAIDLLNERLEAEIAPSGAPSLQTTLEEDELAARPEHVHGPAYDRLAEPTAYPFELPYVVWLDQSRTFLAALGVERGALMAGLADVDAHEALQRPEIAAEWLGLDRAAWTELSGARAATSTAERWGVGAAPAPATTSALASVPVFLAQAGVRSSGEPLPYAGLEDLVRSSFVQRAGLLWIWFDNEVCDIAAATLVSDDLDAHLDRAATLLRLSRALGWSLARTDRALEIFGGLDGIDEPVLLALAGVRWLARALHLDPEAVLEFYGRLDTRRWTPRIADGVPDGASPPTAARGRGRRPVIDAANAGDGDTERSPFQRRVGALDDAGVFALLDDGTALADESELLEAHADAVASVVGVEPAWLPTLTNGLGLTNLTLGSLSALARHGRLARALDLEPAELLRWSRRLDADPFASPRETVRLVVEAQRQASLRLSEEALTTLLAAPGSRALERLALPTVGEAMLALSDDERAEFGAPTESRERRIVRRAAALLDVDPALLQGLLKVPFGGRDALDALLAAVAAVEAARRADPEAHASTEAVAALIDPRLWELVALSAWLARVVDLSPDGVSWLVDADPATRGFDVAAIVLGATERDRYRHFAALREAARLRALAGGVQLFDLWARLAQGSLSAAGLRSALAERTGWSEDGLRELIDDSFTGPLGGASALDWASPARFGRLVRAMHLSRSVGASPSAVVRWSSLRWEPGLLTDPIAAYQRDAAEIEQALRATWGTGRWLAEMPGVREGLRERARAALVAKLVGDPAHPFADADALGASLLMDVHLGACVKTSRLKDATRAVQSFVQRILLGQEPGLSLTDEEADEWQWRRRFRVWEANRKVFLYPENWIRPELLRARTPLLTALASDLSQGELTDEAVEEAYLAYVRELTAVSKLETLAILREPRDGASKDVFHVFARTREQPATYWHRRWIEESRWTPWEKLTDVEGEHLVPVVYQRRVMLCWLNLSTNTQPMEGSTMPALSGAAPPRLWQFHLSRSEWRDGRWSPPRRSEAYIGFDEHGVPSPPLLNRDTVTVGDPGTDGEAFTVRTPRGRIYAGASVDEPDLLVDVFKAVPGNDPLTKDPFPDTPIARFRVSAIDGSVRAEEPPVRIASAPDLDAGDEETLADRAARGEYGPAFLTENEAPWDSASEYAPQAQRFRGTGALFLPFADGVVSTPDRQLVVRTRRGRPPRITMTPVDRVAVDPTDPFVFDDELGAYWVTYRGVHETYFVEDTPFDAGPYRHDELSLPPGARAEFEARLEGLAERIAVGGTDAGAGPGEAGLLPEGLIDVVGNGREIATINGQPVVAPSNVYGLSMAMTVERADGTVLTAAETSSSGEHDLVASLVLRIPEDLFVDEADDAGSPRLLARVATYRFRSFFHPHVGLLRQTLNERGVRGLIDPPPDAALAGQDPPPPGGRIERRYLLPGVAMPYPRDDLDFEVDGAYAQYNWELFFHAPFLIAARLHEAGRFDEALRWLHVIFDPMRPARAGADAGEVARSFWRFRPFREEFAADGRAPRNIQQLIALLSADASDSEALEEAERLLSQIAEWRRNPFDPHAIARTRPVAYMAAVVMRYLDVVLDQADARFRELTLESIAEATELLLLAARILGDRPEPVDVGESHPPTFAQLLDDFDAGIGPIERAEEIVEAWEVAADALPMEADSLATLLYFCTPANPQLLTRYWDRVADRLFKIRHCLDMEGHRAELALYEPPIDPELLVRAAAAGVDLQTLLSDVTAGVIPHRRYAAMVELAGAFAASTQSLGQGLLSAIEKRDGDQLAALRQRHERTLQDDAIAARREQVVEAEQQLESLRRSRDAIEMRRAFFADRPRMNQREADAMRGAGIAKDAHIAATTSFALAPFLALIPQFQAGGAGAAGSPVAVLSYGGMQAAGFASGVGQLNANIAAFEDRQGAMALTESGYDRRKVDWDHQAETAAKELEAADARIAAAEIRLALAEAALATAETRMAQLEEIRTVFERRFAREELFQWLSTQLAGLHYASYELAFELAKKAERAWEYELGKTSPGFIQFGYWDGQKKGLLAAERLAYDLRRMQVAYLDEQKRRLEVEQTFSLREIDPLALLRLQQRGEATFTLPEAYFDLSYPGQYRRRIRAVRFTMPAVVPPHANVPAHFTLTGHRIRSETDLSAAVPEAPAGLYDPPVAMTATSAGQRDAGLFELSFASPRLLPFEGAGALSDWRVQLPQAVWPIDYRQIQDLLVHVAYDADYSDGWRAALESGDPAPVVSRLFATGPRRVISLRREHPAAFRRLVSAPLETEVRFEIPDEAIPAHLRRLDVTLANPAMIATGADVGGLELLLEDPPTPVSGFAPSTTTSIPQVDVSAALGPVVGRHVLRVRAWGGVDPEDPTFDLLIVADVVPA